MTDRKIFKYAAFLFLGGLISYHNIHFGDYCEGIAQSLLWLILIILFVFVFLIVEVRDLYKLLAKKERFDRTPMIMLLFFTALNWLLITANENNFYRTIRYEGVIENENIRGRIVLYDNDTFEATNLDIEYRCTFFGNYHIEKNAVILDDEDIESKTENHFTKRYLVISDSILQPMKINFSRIKLGKEID